VWGTQLFLNLLQNSLDSSESEYAKLMAQQPDVMQSFINRITLTTLTLLVSFGHLVVPSQAADHDISMTANGFVPSYLEVTVGDRVYWWNDDDYFFDDHSTHSFTYP